MNTTESSDNKKNDRHNKIVKQISKLEFEKDVINELMEMFDAKQKEIDQVKKKEESLKY